MTRSTAAALDCSDELVPEMSYPRSIAGRLGRYSAYQTHDYLPMVLGQPRWISLGTDASDVASPFNRWPFVPLYCRMCP